MSSGAKMAGGYSPAVTIVLLSSLMLKQVIDRIILVTDCYMYNVVFLRVIHYLSLSLIGASLPIA
jgi:hypothetical protein